MRRISSKAITFSILLLAQVAASAAPGDILPATSADALRAPGESHPIIGKWQWTRSENGCTEVFNFQTNGTVSVVSGKERTDNTFVIARSADADGFYAMSMTITKDHGGIDCADTQTDDTGVVSRSAVLFEPGEGRHLSCKTARLGNCYGPLTRMRDGS